MVGEIEIKDFFLEVEKSAFCFSQRRRQALLCEKLDTKPSLRSSLASKLASSPARGIAVDLILHESGPPDVEARIAFAPRQPKIHEIDT